MVSIRFGRVLVGVAILGLLLAVPTPSAAQSSTFVIPFDRTGEPGTREVVTTDPLTLEPITTIVETGAFYNPCTLENVDVTGSTTIATVQTVDKFGTVKVNVSTTTKGLGSGWIPGATGPFFTASKYAFTDSQQFTFRLPSVGEEFSSDFSDKLALRGAKSTDNWVIRAHFRIKVNASGVVQVSMIKMNADACKG